MVYFSDLSHRCADFSSQVKRQVVNDPRYDAVGSSSMREELFNTFMKAHGTSTIPESSTNETPVEEGEHADGKEDHIDKAERERKRREKKERAVKEREEKVKAERNKVAADIDRSRMGLNKEEGELEFRCAACLAFNLCGCWAPLTIFRLYITERCSLTRYETHRYDYILDLT